MPPSLVNRDLEESPGHSSRDRAVRSRLWTLWVLVSALWELATLLRIRRVWVPQVGWHRLIGGPWMWISFIVPPCLFALILGAIQNATDDRR
jgi:hypothetical protein